MNNSSKAVPGDYVLFRSITKRILLLRVYKVSSEGYYVQPIFEEGTLNDPNNPPDPCFIPFKYDYLITNVGKNLDAIKLLYEF